MPLPKIRIGVHEVTRHGAIVLQLGPNGFYADVDDIAAALHMQPAFVYGALAAFQDKRTEDMIAKAKGEH